MISVNHLRLYFEKCKKDAENDLVAHDEWLLRAQQELEELQSTSLKHIINHFTYRIWNKQQEIKSISELKHAVAKYIEECEGFLDMLSYRAKWENVSTIDENDPIIARVKMQQFYSYMKTLGLI